ncbi:MAG: hypothetical protein AAF532_10960 [Planctomycetota bacterium]
MGGYFLYSVDRPAFTRLVTEPTEADGDALATALLEELADLKLTYGKYTEELWPGDKPALSARVREHLVRPDWYAGLKAGDALIWDNVVESWNDEAGRKIGIGFDVHPYEMVSFDIAEEAAQAGAGMLAEPDFGGGGYRLDRTMAGAGIGERMYSLYEGDGLEELLRQLRAVKPHFEAMPRDEPEDEEDDYLDDESPRGQFLFGLLAAVEEFHDAGRVFWVQTDT